MKAAPLIINWHDQNAPVYSAHFEPGGKGRLATAGGDNHVRIWKVDTDGPDRKVEYLSTLSKHNQAVNVVRWAPKGEVLASAGDDGNVILWVPSELPPTGFGSDAQDDKESWRAKHMCRSSGAEIYDLAWSPDAAHFIIGSMDNIARIYNANTGSLVRQIAEHSHYVQGVTWDPLNEYIATQSSDRSVHIYSLKTKDGQYTLSQDDKPPRLASHIKADLPPRRISSSSPAPPDFGHRSQLSVIDSGTSVGSPVPSAPGTPTSFAVPMNPPSVVSHSRRSSFSSRRSVSPAPSMPLPAVMPMEASPKPHSMAASLGLSVKNASLYANETLTSFFRRLTFTPDGSLLLTPSGQYQTQHQADKDAKPTYEVINTVYIYTRGGINKPPIAHLPGHKKPSVVVKCSPIFYTLRQSPPSTKHITIDTSSPEEPLPSLPDPVAKPSPATSVMDPPPPPSTAASDTTSGSKSANVETDASTPGPKPAFSLPYRMVYAVATQDAVLLYDTQQKTPICVVSNLHCATFTDLAWASDGLTLVISSSDGFCSTLSFAAGELGDVYKGEVGPPKSQQATAGGSANPAASQNTPVPTPTTSFAPPSPFHNGTHHQHRNSASSFTAPSPPPSATGASQRPSSPTRSNSTSSIATQSSSVPTGVVSNPPLVGGNMPSLTAGGKSGGVPMTTPPETPRQAGSVTAGTKRDASESEKEDTKEPKKRRIAPTPVDTKPATS
ncbi:Chromatin assembly factor 1 subunit [Purpureocillium takamizusanense]|uniref:Chromatin assembly factor 1 subunit n=1 Tax=Purpureocillium takamizusanense TaxID=2060973 RepID=A0A9Q8QRJ8_9HYPO|nr:Chromatin assembly factor 1 subunit [Purpureocillium takamizusanense]UNI23459.1 Chromatin assembly factor 1 subunit [Purpureocillium takamizusanense]